MYRGEGDESELASLSAPVVMSLSKTSLIFNGAQLQGKREKRRAHNSHARTHTHTTLTYADNTLQTCTECSKLACADREHTCTLALRRKQGSLRVNGVETQGPRDWELHSAWRETKREAKKNWGALA